ncbi:putative oxidoreductase [Talaromyces proteolyticus]|uniref:Oxidoreductase n=1 Tax=Talaromyces proteolyticus TaxID=1131652 RepID=A0AAD4KL40_9EURO|nr:putative oxidoreductase [Talaromyces proteolyticus]KAH8692742.1 putative oxidoreductase [Talaromyces proteolyticus]
MPAIPHFSSLLYWAFYLVPVYLFIIVPGLRALFPHQTPGPLLQDDFYDDEFTGGLESVADDTEYAALSCPEDPYRVHIFSRTPLIVYIENFLSESETNHLLDVSEGKYKPSSIYNGDSERVDFSVRRSDRALLDRDNVVRCLEERARSFQGWRPYLHIEQMWTQRYNVSGHYRHHFDWSGSGGAGDRVSTFMVYLQMNGTGGGTNFPRLRRPRGAEWCRFIECDDVTGKNSPDRLKGITFKPIEGNAIFWENLRADGSGYLETWHAALPVLSGTKVGMNIWSWNQPPSR